MNLEKKVRRLQKEWRQGKYKGAVRTAGMCVATACVVLLGVYFFQGRRAEKDIDSLRSMRQEALKNGDSGQEPLGIADRQVLGENRDLFLENPDLIGWVTINGTKIDYPVMWTPENPEYYSTRGFDRTESKNGLLFLDAKSNINESGGNLIIYGHNMKNGSMFADLLKYKKESYWKEHPTIQLDTLYDSRSYEITAVAATNDLDMLPYAYTGADDNAMERALESMKEIALYDTGIETEPGDDHLTLSTCDYSETDGRLVVMARRIK